MKSVSTPRLEPSWKTLAKARIPTEPPIRELTKCGHDLKRFKSSVMAATPASGARYRINAQMGCPVKMTSFPAVRFACAPLGNP